jgi:hypothetical protein
LQDDLRPEQPKGARQSNLEGGERGAVLDIEFRMQVRVPARLDQFIAFPGEQDGCVSLPEKEKT